jgi:hypothetical protein
MADVHLGAMKFSVCDCYPINPGEWLKRLVECLPPFQVAMKNLMNRLPGTVVPSSILGLFGGFWPLFQTLLQLFVEFGHLTAAHSWDHHHHGPHSLCESFKTTGDGFISGHNLKHLCVSIAAFPKFETKPHIYLLLRDNKEKPSLFAGLLWMI